MLTLEDNKNGNNTSSKWLYSARQDSKNFIFVNLINIREGIYILTPLDCFNKCII